LNVSDLDAVNRSQIQRAGARYTPGLDPAAPNIEVEGVARALAFLGMHPSHRAHIRSLKKAVDDRIHFLPKRLEQAFRGRKFTPAYVSAALDRLSDAGPEGYSAVARELRRSVGAVQRTLSRLDTELYEQELAAETDESRRRVRDEQGELRRVRAPILDVGEFVESPPFSLLTTNAMLLLGLWGTGKTHTLCDVAEDRMQQGLPTLLYLAHSLPSQRDPLQGLCDATGLAAAPEALLGGLQQLGEAAGCRALLMIDGINEGDRESWSRHLPAIVRAVQRYSHVGLVISCRQPFETLILTDRTTSKFVTVEHHGFTDVEVDAQVAFFTYYDIPAPHAPLLTPEFSRPLFLKMLCESVKNRARNHKSSYVRGLASGQKGMTLVLEDFAKEIGKPIERDFGLRRLTCWKLLKGDVLTPGGPLTGLAPTMAQTMREYVSREECLDLIQRLTPLRCADQRDELLRRLLADGLLAEGMTWRDGAPVPVIQFPYQRFGDHLIARHLLDRYLNTQSDEAIRRSFYVNRPLGRLFDLSPGGLSYRHPGLASAVMLEFPERVKRAPVPSDERELVAYLPRARRLAGPLFDVFLEGLYWRPADSFTRATEKIIHHYLGLDHEWTRQDVLEVLVSLATRVGHPYSAERLYRFIHSQEMPDRDLFWSEFLRGTYRDSAVSRLIEWIDATEGSPRDGAVVGNCITLLSLILTTTRRALRDRATRALYLLGLERPRSLFDHTVMSLDFNDPYVPERMLAASYGVAMSMWADPDGARVRSALPAFARELVRCMFLPRGRKRTAHVLMQEYALGIIDLARRVAPRCVPKLQLSYLSRPLTAVRSPFPPPGRIDETEAEGAKSAIHMDFENYTLGRLVPGRGNYDFQHEGYRAVRKQVLWRIGDLGYSEERFRAVDVEIPRAGERRPDLDPSRVDRYGKKYSWIAFFEMYGVRLDAGLLNEERTERPSDVDIDPSFPPEPNTWIPPLSGILDSSPSDPREWLTCGATPDYEELLHRRDVDGALGPWVLLEGWLEERASTDKRRLFTFLWSRLVTPAALGRLVTTFLRRDYPGNHEIPSPIDDFYTFAGEVPWSARYAAPLRTPNGDAERHVDTAFSWYAADHTRVGIPVEIPVYRWDWESYHSAANQVSGAYFLAPALCERLRLVNHARDFDLYDGDGKRATVFTTAESDDLGANCHFLFIRSDLLDRYLRETDQRLIWFVWGERDLKVESRISQREEWSDVFQRYENLHRQAYVWDRRHRRPLLLRDD
jgi:hypothetical protein